MLFVLGMVLLLPVALMPVGWLSARGWLVDRAAWTAAVHLAAFISALLPTLVAARMEDRPVACYGLPWKLAFGARFWEGTAWGLGATTLLVGLLWAMGCWSVDAAAVPGRDTLRAGAVWALAMLGLALFEESAKRGYLQHSVAVSLGFWPAALLLSSLFGAEKLLSESYRNPVALAAAVAYGMLLCLALDRTGSLWFGVGLHAALRWATVYVYGIGIPITPARPPGALLRPALVGPWWITGGEFGPDASVLTLTLIALLWLALRRRFPDQATSPSS